MKNNDPLYWPSFGASEKIRQLMSNNWDRSSPVLQAQWAQCEIDQRFAMGDADLWNTLFPSQVDVSRRVYNFNLINSTIQMITGFQRRNRKSSICVPVRNALQQTSDQLSKCLFHVHDINNGYHVYSDGFEQGALIQGMGLIRYYLDTRYDPISPEVRMKYIDFKSVVIDPFFRNPDLSDCRYIWTRQYMTREECAAYYSKYYDYIMQISPVTPDEKFYYMPEVYQIQYSDLISVDEFHYQSQRKAKFLIDKETEETQEITFGDEHVGRIMRAFPDRLTVIDKYVPTVSRCITLNNEVLSDTVCPDGIDRMPFTATLGYFSPDTPYFSYKFRGVVRDMRDAQYLFTRRKLADLDILENQQQGLKIREGSLVTPKDALNAGHGRALFYKKNASPDDIQPMPIIPPAPTMIQMEELLKELMNRISGVNETLLGTDINDKAGIISAMRQSAGITTLTRLFDQMDLTQQLGGQIIIELIQKNWTYGKVKQVIGEEPTAEFDNKAFFKYGCKVVPGALTETQQQLQLQQLLYFREVTGVQIPDRVIIEASTLQNKGKLIEALEEQAKQQAEMAKEEHDLKMQQLDVDTKTKLAYAESQLGLAAERRNKIGLDVALNVERIAQAKEDRSASLLNLVKTVKELQSIDIEHLQGYIDIMERLQPSEAESNTAKSEV